MIGQVKLLHPVLKLVKFMKANSIGRKPMEGIGKKSTQLLLSETNSANKPKACFEGSYHTDRIFLNGLKLVQLLYGLKSYIYTQQHICLVQENQYLRYM